MSVRVYLPVTSTALAELVDIRRLSGALAGHSVTDRLREEWPEGDDEQWEYAALHAAAADSWQLRGDADLPRRFVIAADVGAVSPDPDRDDVTAVRVEFDVAWKNVAAAQVDPADLPEGLADDELDDHELAWFATQEIPGLLDL